MQTERNSDPYSDRKNNIRANGKKTHPVLKQTEKTTEQ